MAEGATESLHLDMQAGGSKGTLGMVPVLKPQNQLPVTHLIQQGHSF